MNFLDNDGTTSRWSKTDDDLTISPEKLAKIFFQIEAPE